MSNDPLVGIAMGSASDLPTLQPAAEILQRFGVPHEVRVLSAHRTPDAMAAYAREAVSRGLKVLIAGAGGAAHLPGMLAANTPLPNHRCCVNHDPERSGRAAVDCPDAARRPCRHGRHWRRRQRCLLAVQILATSDPALLQQLLDYKAELAATARQQDADLSR